MNNSKFDRVMRAADYIFRMRPVFNTQALFSDGTKYYVSPMEPDPGDTVSVRLRTGRFNTDAAFLVYGKERLQMSVESFDEDFEYYSVSFEIGKEAVEYYFEIHCGRYRCFYNRYGTMEERPVSGFFRLSPGFHTPEWAKGAVFYQILVDRFCNGDPGNDVIDREYSYIHGVSHHVTDWYQRPEAMDVRNFYGGDLAGVMSKLDYLQALGVEVIYFNPLFVSPSNHKYDIQDYDYIDPHLGPMPHDEGEVLPDNGSDNRLSSRYQSRVTNVHNLDAANGMFIRLVDECHRRGMKVILDGVFNHCGSFNKWMDREGIYEGKPGFESGAYHYDDSPYRSFFAFQDPTGWPYNDSYEGWWGHDTLPKLNYEGSPKLEEYILSIAAKWLLPPYNADGWRLDVAADLGHSQEYNHSFWKKFRKVVRSAKPDALIIAEHYGDPSSWLRGDEWDTVMNYDAFMEPMTWFFTGMEKHSDASQGWLLNNADSFMDAMRYNMACFMQPSLEVAMNELSNHDHSRFLTRTNGVVGRMDQFDYDAASTGIKPAVMREAVIMQMTWPGAPTVYYGDEAGVCGFTDPDNRRTYPWGREDRQMLDFHRMAISLHKDHEALRRGSHLMLYGTGGLLAYARFTPNDKVVTVFNNHDEEKEITIPVWRAGIVNRQELTRIFVTDEEGYRLEHEPVPVRSGEVTLKMAPRSSVVLAG